MNTADKIDPGVQFGGNSTCGCACLLVLIFVAVKIIGLIFDIRWLQVTCVVSIIVVGLLALITCGTKRE